MATALPLHLLRLFAGVVEHGGFSRAAEALHVSQPAVSKGVRELEARLGASLIDRGPGRVRLTDAGRLLALRARELFAVERTALEELRAVRGLERGSLRIGASTTIATYHLPAILAALCRRHPGVALQLSSANTAAVVEMFLARDVDVALVEGTVSHPNIQVVPWREEAMALVAAPGHPLAGSGRIVQPHELEGELLVVRERGSGTREIAEQALLAIGASPTRILEIGSTEAIKQAVAAGLGMAIVSAIAARDQLALGKLTLVPLAGAEANLRRTLYRLNLPGRSPSAATAAFEALLGEQDQDA